LTLADLILFESVGGHTLGRHVDKSEEWLRERLGTKGLKEASSFTSIDEATECVSAALELRRNEVEKWLADGSHRRLELEVDWPCPVGRVVVRDHGVVTHGSRVRVVLARYEYGAPPFYVLTAYPRR
jgi:hypothetical protein